MSDPYVEWPSREAVKATGMPLWPLWFRVFLILCAMFVSGLIAAKIIDESDLRDQANECRSRAGVPVRNWNQVLCMDPGMFR